MASRQFSSQGGHRTGTFITLIHAHCGSFMPGEQDIYEEHVLDHYEDPYHRGALAAATHMHHGKNPLCGDRIRVELKLDEDGRVEEAWFDGDGCVISQASASMLIEAIEGKSIDEVRQFSAPEMLKLFGPQLTPNRQKCCLLSWKVLQGALVNPVGSGHDDAMISSEDDPPASNSSFNGPSFNGPSFNGPSLGEEQ